MPLVVVALGNPGARYKDSRHNVGFRIVDLLSRRTGTALKKRLFKRYLIGKGWYERNPFYLAKPLTFMNQSGAVSRDILRETGASFGDLVVLFDSLDLPTGSCRLRRSGSSGGHRGLESMIRALGTEQFMRLGVGIGKPANKEATVDWVLGEPRGLDRRRIEEGIARAAEGVLLLLTHGPEKAMNEVNRTSRDAED